MIECLLLFCAEHKRNKLCKISRQSKHDEIIMKQPDSEIKYNRLLQQATPWF